ncbi:MAG: hypothetical protein ACLQMF_08105 [Rectinemataceae bacterium]
MVEAVSSGYFPLSYIYAMRYDQDKITVPVHRSEALYANFRHVAGVPAQDGAAALGIDKLQILEVLIDQLESVENQPPAPVIPKDLSSKRIDALIQQYGSEMHAIAAAPAPPYASVPAIAPGALFSIAA